MPVKKLVDITTKASGALLIAAGLGVMAAWFAGHPLHIYFNNGVDFFVGGLGLIAAARPGGRLLSLGCAIFCAAFAISVGLQYVLGASFGIDVYFGPALSSPASHPGRMAPGTVCCFILGGLAIALARSRRESRLALVLLAGVVMMAATLITFSGFFAGVRRDAHGLSLMAPGTAILFFIFSVGVISLACQRSLLLGGRLAYSWLPAMGGLLGLAITIALTLGFTAEARLQMDQALADESAATARVIQMELTHDIRSLTHMQGRWAGWESKAAWEADAKRYLRDYPVFHGFALIQPDRTIASTVNRRADPFVWDHLVLDPALLARISAADSVVLTRDGQGADGAPLIIGYLPLRGVGGGLDGYVAAAYDVQGVLMLLTNLGWDEGTRITVSDNRGVLAVRSALNSDASFVSHETRFLFNGASWTVEVSKPSVLNAYRGLIIMIFGGGAVLSFALATALHQMIRGQFFAQQASETADRLRENEEALKRSNKDLEQFAYVASHDLKAPLRGIDNLARWISEDLAGAVTPEAQRKIDLLLNRVNRLEKILDDILAYSRAGRIVEKPADIDCWQLIEGLSVDFPRRYAIQAESRLPVIRSPRTPLEQIFSNLFSNAIKHHDRPEGTIKVAAYEQGLFYEFIVQDDGPGIPEEYRTKVFDMFRTLRPRDKVEGSGLGLSIIKKLVEWQGGRCWITSHDGRGTTFHFLWPKDFKVT